jgi:uncharacterized repeat protein (TIGR02543 family)
VEENTAIGAGNMPGDPVLGGYTFKGWNTAPDGTGTVFTASTVVTGNTIVYAQWEKIINYYTVTFDGNGGDPVIQTRVVEEGGMIGINIPAIPVRPGYHFAGRWNTAADGSGTDITPVTPITGDIRAYAQWEKDVVYVAAIFNYNYGDFTQEVCFVEQGTALGTAMPANPVRGGHTFKGWNTAPDGTGTAFTASTAVANNIMVYAQWERDIVNYNVTFNGNEGAPAQQVRSVAENASLGTAMPANPTRSGYIFTGWNTKADGTGTAFTATTAVVGDITVYAQWRPGNTFNVVFSGNDGEPYEQVFAVEENGTLGAGMPADPTRSGYKFIGWNTSIGGIGTAFTSTTVVRYNMKVYAQWVIA